MIDPLAEMVTLLQPSTPHSKIVEGAGQWRVRRSDLGQPFYCAMLEGGCRLLVGGQAPVTLAAGDFVLVPAARDFATTSLEPPAPDDSDAPPFATAPGAFRLGDREGAPDVRFVVGHCEFGSPDAALLVSLLPQLLHIRGEGRLATLVQLVRDESRAQRPARDVVLARLLEVLFIEALRAAAASGADQGSGDAPGLLRGLADARLAAALRRMHEAPARNWTVADLAREAALSRSSFFERFSRAVGTAPMEYLLAWRMALAKDLLRRGAGGIAEVAARVGYSSASTFSVAFARHVGVPPARYARAGDAVAA
ncbi:AraC family transcriptional regulator [Massilia phyllosphaerae]|uniref:AraC family transcriptional regulator n=1 Tax=Massilia phyllosphaerae TaxID=3106034 RepID=UPI002B1CD954|nr:AraC family transcriptional regulator [Massilia sp. SGZ-792]